MNILFAVIIAVVIQSFPYPSFADSEVRKDTRVTGTIHCMQPVHTDENSASQALPKSGYGLRLDKPIVFAKGSKSERTVSALNLILSAMAKNQASKLEGRHVEISGSMECTMHFSPWVATCDLSVDQISELQ